jgi:uncharacterized protein (TIGR00661 family)
LPTKILYAVLNWGLGHASRSIPIIQSLLKKNIELVIASDGEALVLLQKEFPSLTFEVLPSYNVQYAENAKNFDKAIFFQLGKFGKTVKEENKLTDLLIRKHNLTHLISDNRYGVYSKTIPSTIICHQINLQHKIVFVKKQMNKVHFSLLKKFTEIWVPDFEDKMAIAPNISILEFKNKSIASKLKYIGLLSRMEKNEPELNQNIVSIILSGPEPQRTILEEELLEQITTLKEHFVLVRGTEIFEKAIQEKENLKVFSLLKTAELNELINQSKLVICRAGYSSIMDLLKLEKPAIIIPTPGQTEQEYLATHLQNKNWFYSSLQEKLILKKALQESQNYTLPKKHFSEEELEKTIANFLSLQ